MVLADEEEDEDDDKEPADVEDDSVEDDKTEDEDKTRDEKIKTLIQSTVEYLIQGSAIPKSKQHRLKMLLDDIAQNRYRVQSILKRLADAEGEEQLSFTLEQLAREELLSEEQHLEVAETGVIKNAKVGQGLKFLPRKLNALVKSLQVLLEELAEAGKTEVRN